MRSISRPSGDSGAAGPHGDIGDCNGIGDGIGDHGDCGEGGPRGDCSGEIKPIHGCMLSDRDRKKEQTSRVKLQRIYKSMHAHNERTYVCTQRT